MKEPRRTVRLLTRDQSTVVAALQLPQTFEPYEVIVWNGRYFVPQQNAHDDAYHEAVSFYAITGD